MKIKYLIKFLILLILVFVLQSIVLVNKSNAAIESKSGTSKHNWITVNNSFQYCYDMRYPTSSLGNNSLDPHLITATDWGITAYLGLSSYGAVKNTTGPQVSIDSRNYYTSTGNKTGVMNLGATRTQTASYLQGSTSASNCNKLYLESNSKYVNQYTSSNSASENIGMAYGETNTWYGNGETGHTNRLGSRSNFIGGTWGENSQTDGAGNDNLTYRPVIWN